jgi:hypothetical protein
MLTWLLRYPRLALIYHLIRLKKSKLVQAKPQARTDKHRPLWRVDSSLYPSALLLSRFLLQTRLSCIYISSSFAKIIREFVQKNKDVLDYLFLKSEKKNLIKLFQLLLLKSKNS